MEYPGFWLCMALLAAGGLSLTISFASMRDNDWIGGTLALALSAAILGIFFV